MKKLALLFLLGISLLLALLLGAMGSLLGTEAGTTWLLTQLQARAPAIFQVGSIQGHFMGRLVLGDVRLTLDAAETRVQQLVFDWSPRALLRRELIVNELSLWTLRFDGEPTQEKPPAEPLQWPIELPEFSPPLRLEIRQLSVTDAVVVMTPEATRLVIDQASLVAHWGAQGLVLERLASSGPTHSLLFTGRLDPMNAYALHLENRVALGTGSDTAIELQGFLQGFLQGETQRLEMQQLLSGAAQLKLDATLEQPLSAPRWNAVLQLLALRGELLSEALPVVLSGRLEATGDLSTLTLLGQLATASESREFDKLEAQLDLQADLEDLHLRVDQLEITQRGQPLRLSLTGEIASDQTLDLTLDWEALQWPLVGKAAVRSNSGEGTVRGATSDYRLEVSARIDGQSIPPGQWRLTAAGDQERLQVENLNGRLLGGELDLHGDLGWAPQLAWDMEATARQISLQELTPDIDGFFNLDVHSDGRVSDAGPEAQVVLQSLTGRLNGQALRGSGKILYNSDRIEVQRLRIENADARLLASGILGQQSDLAWELKIPNLDRLLIDGSGSLFADGRVSGPQQTPRVVGEIRASGLAFQSVKIEKLNADVDLDLQDRRRSSINVTGDKLSSGEELVDHLQLTFDGFIRDHRLALTASHPQGEIDTALKGAYADQHWRGSLVQLDLDTEPLGRWQLQRPAELNLATTSAQAETLCLQREGSRLCAEGEWQAQGNTRGEFELTALPLAWFKPFLPEDILGITGTLSANGKIDQGSDLKGLITAKVTPGEMTFSGKRKDRRMPYSGATLQANTRGQGVTATLKAGVGSSTLDAKLALPDLFDVSDREQAALKAKLNLEAPDLAIVSLLAPAVTTIDGNISAHFNLSGRLGQPRLGGSGQLRLSRLQLAELGLRMTDTRLDLGVSGNRLSVEGSAVSGGRIDLHGGLEMNAQKGWPFALTIVGKDFMATDQPNLQIQISPDLKVEKRAGTLALTGRLDIPQAEIIIRDLPSGARTASRDVVVVREESSATEAPEEATPIATNITVALGNKVHVAALGLNAFVRGEVSLRANPGKPLRAHGDVRIDEGTFRAYSQELEIERGIFTYTNSPIDNPGINVRATRSIEEVMVGVNAVGTARQLTISTFSSPGMSENDRISYLVTGKPTGQGATLALNREVYKNLSLGVTLDTRTGERAFVTRYRIHRTLHTEVSSSARSSTLDLFYTLERR